MRGDGNPIDLVGAVHVAVIRVDDAVTIEERRGPSAPGQQFPPSLVQASARMRRWAFDPREFGEASEGIAMESQQCPAQGIPSPSSTRP